MNWIIGDIHGYLNLLKKIINEIAKNDKDPCFIFIGDYVDRGPNSFQVVEYLINLEHNKIFLRGNHDDIFDYIINDHCLSHIESICPKARGHSKVEINDIFPWWFSHGFNDYVMSYDNLELSQMLLHVLNLYKDNNMIDFNIYLYKFIDKLKELTPQSHKDFFMDLNMFWENDTHFACHARYDLNKELPRKMDFTKREEYSTILWTRFEWQELLHNSKWDKIGVFGHTPIYNYGAKEPIKSNNIRLIDMGCFFSNKLCAYCCETDNFLIVGDKNG